MQQSFVYDWIKRKFISVSVDNNGNEGNSSSFRPKISTNGRYVGFLSSASNLVENDSNGKTNDVFVHDLQTRLTTIISLDDNGNQVDSRVHFPGYDNSKPISGDGRYVVLCGKLTDEGGCYIHDIQTNENLLLPKGDNYSISGDGRYIAFSSGPGIVENDTNGKLDIFVYDRGAGSNATISGVIKPKVYITTNSYLYSKESPDISVYVSTDVEGAEMTEELYDIYVAVGGPNGLALFDSGRGISGLTTEAIPYLANVIVMESDWVETFNYEFTEDAPAGDYFVHIGVLDQKDNLISEDIVVEAIEGTSPGY